MQRQYSSRSAAQEVIVNKTCQICQVLPNISVFGSTLTILAMIKHTLNTCLRHSEVGVDGLRPRIECHLVADCSTNAVTVLLMLIFAALGACCLIYHNSPDIFRLSYTTYHLCLAFP